MATVTQLVPTWASRHRDSVATGLWHHDWKSARNRDDPLPSCDERRRMARISEVCIGVTLCLVSCPTSACVQHTEQVPYLSCCQEYEV